MVISPGCLTMLAVGVVFAMAGKVWMLVQMYDANKAQEDAKKPETTD